MLFGVVHGNERRYLYRIEWLQKAKPHDRMSLIVTDFGEKQWSSGFTGKEILGSFDSDIIPTWNTVRARIQKAVENNELEIDTTTGASEFAVLPKLRHGATGMLHCPFDITKSVRATLRLPPKRHLLVHGVPEGHADVGFSLFRAWREMAYPNTPSTICNRGRTTHAEKSSPSSALLGQEQMDVESSETPVKPKRSFGHIKTIDSLSKSAKKKQRRSSLRSK